MASLPFHASGWVPGCFHEAPEPLTWCLGRYMLHDIRAASCACMTCSCLCCSHDLPDAAAGEARHNMLSQSPSLCSAAAVQQIVGQPNWVSHLLSGGGCHDLCADGFDLHSAPSHVQCSRRLTCQSLMRLAAGNRVHSVLQPMTAVQSYPIVGVPVCYAESAPRG